MILFRSKAFVGILIGLLFCPLPSIGKSKSTPQSFVKILEGEVRDMLSEGDVAGANRLFAEHLDMPIFSRRCLVDHWSEFTNAEQLRYQNLLEANIRKRMSEKTMLVPEDTSFQLNPQRVRSESGGLIRVDSTLRVKGNDVELGIVLVKRGEKYWVVDYDFDGALLSRNYRGRFNYLIRKYGKAEIFKRLESKLKPVDN